MLLPEDDIYVYMDVSASVWKKVTESSLLEFLDMQYLCNPILNQSKAFYD